MNTYNNDFYKFKFGFFSLAVLTVNQAFSPSSCLGSQTSRMYRAVNKPTNANKTHASVIMIPRHMR